jgi:anthranilate/para-aminobenzoate synthase component II
LPQNGDEDTLSSLLDDAFDGIVITVSHYNIRDNKPWFSSLCELICTAAKEGYPRIYGGCFGCQIIAHALGGHVDRNPNQKFILRAESVTIDVTLLTRNLIPGYSSHDIMMRLLSLNESSCAETTTTTTSTNIEIAGISWRLCM